MTEDKFEVKLNKGVISIWEDDVKCILVTDNKKVDIGTIVHILNKQDKEIKELKKDINQYKILVESLKDENQRLKLRLKDLGVEYI